MEIKYTWHKIARHISEISFNSNGLAEVDAAGKKICLALFREQLLACVAKCPHAGGTMAEGYVNAMGEIICPVHQYKFSLKNGRNSSGEGYILKTYLLEEREDGIFICLPA